MEDIVVNKDTVFYPTIKRIRSEHKKELSELLNIIPAKPVTPKDDTVKNTCEFYPRTDKFYVPKKKSRLKVKTVRDIRKSFEEETYAYLPNELENQQSALLKKIRLGSSRDESTKELARTIFKSDIPISRSTWQVLVNINPEQYLHPRQFVIWNGKHIQVNGSKGGNDKYICHETVHNKNLFKNITSYKKKGPYKKKGLLRDSLTVKFKPGPLGRKKFLDDSHQKYQVGDIELVKLPIPGLDVNPTLGAAFEPTVIHYLNNLRKEDGTITEKWAEFAVSVLGTVERSDSIQVNKECVTFDLNYKCDQHRILMRRDIDSCYVPKATINERTVSCMEQHDDIVLPEVKDMMTQILDCIEISVSQNDMYTGEDNVKPITSDEGKEEHTQAKEKFKRKYCELDRLDVTVIRLPEESTVNINKTCKKPFCKFGCVCDSIESSFYLRGHCGIVDCMFECKCDFSKYATRDSLDFESQLIPDLLNLNQGINSKLAKEEKKFHQTVILSGDKSILLKTQKRSTKAPKKYAEFYKYLNAKNDPQHKQIVSIIVSKINCENIEPWCMVHKLYRCFCKGKFIEAVGHATDIKDPAILKDTTGKNNNTVIDDLTPKTDSKSNSYLSEPGCADRYYKSTCSRVSAYAGRKYNDTYYKDTNDKILNMEKNDTKLRNRMLNIMSGGLATEKKISKKKQNKEKETSEGKQNETEEINIDHLNAEAGNLLENTSTNLNQFLSDVDELIMSKPINPDAMTTRSKSKLLPNKTELVAWLEANYKMYKERIEKGVTKISLDPPKAGKVALYPWNFILSRYRERKNFFFVSKQKPFRIYMTVNIKNPIVENCININDIRFAELHNYPVTVKNLLTNATDLKDHFCILCGLSDCWELIGSVSKINDGHKNTQRLEETSDTESVDPFDINPTWGDKSSLESKFNDRDSVDIINNDLSDSEITVEDENFKPLGELNIPCHPKRCLSISESSNDADTSKWFVMTVENDFNEIRFYKRGFFVKYESIVKAINVARLSGKTVRLSSQKCMEQSSDPQFGMYAIPNANEYCVFIGPYEIQDSLGIESIKTIYDVRKIKRTRGFWITTNKIDNLNVIDDPLSFMNNIKGSETVPLDCHPEPNDKPSLKYQDTWPQKSEEFNKNIPSTSKGINKKIVKPIKIRKTNGFYHLDSNGLLKKNKSSPDQKAKTQSLHSSANIEDNVIGKLLKISQVAPYKILPKPKPSESVSPIKITTVYSMANEDKGTKRRRPEKGMFILKPEEINRKIFENNLTTSSSIQSEGDDNSVSLDVGDDNTDLEQDLTDSSTCNTSKDNNLYDDVCIISDEENCKIQEDISSFYREVWLMCVNDKLGGVRGRKNLIGHISFKLPNSKYSEFYPEQEAFDKINEELSSKFGLSSANFLWKVVDFDDEIKGIEINVKDHILYSKQQQPPSNLKTYSRTRRKTTNAASPKVYTEIDEKTDLESVTINSGDITSHGSTVNSSELIDIIMSSPDDVKQVMTENLESMLSMAQDLDE